jgi:cell division protein FtsI (penicillin-binding protein 3)
MKKKKSLTTDMFNRNITLKLKAVLKNVVKKGSNSTQKDFSMAGKTGTAQVDYGKDGGSGQYYMLRLLARFYFPADNPKFSCIVVVHKPSTVNNNYYGTVFARPVLKELHKDFYRCSFDKRN